MEKEDRVSTKRDRIKIKFPSGRIFQCTKIDLLQGVSNLPYIYNKSMPSDLSICARNKREEQFNQLVDHICDKVEFFNPSNDERDLINDTFREVWRALRDAYRKNLRLGRTSYKYGSHMEFYRSCFQEEQANVSGSSTSDNRLAKKETMRHKWNLDAAMSSNEEDDDDASSQSSSLQQQLQHEHMGNVATDHNYIALSPPDPEVILSTSSSPHQKYMTDPEHKMEPESPYQPYQHIPTNINSNTEMMLAVISFMHPLLSKLTTQQVLKLIDNITKFLEEHTN